MIPELVELFNMHRLNGVGRGDFMMAYGLPCEVMKLKFLPEKRMMGIMCRDMYTNELQCVQVNQGAEMIVFTPKRREHQIIFVENGEALTNTDVVLELGEFAAKAGDTAHTLEAPTCVKGEWMIRFGIEKITEGAPIDPMQFYNEMKDIEE